MVYTSIKQPQKMKENLSKLLYILIFDFAFLGVNANALLVHTDARCKIWWTGSTYKIMREEQAPVEKGKIVIQSAKNENESFQLAISPNETIENISISISDFSNQKGNVISSKDITIRNVEYVHVTKPSGPRHTAGWYPDPLPLYIKPFRAEAGNNSVILFSVKVPKDASPGVYSAQIQVSLNAEIIVVPVELKVWNFSLPDVPAMRSAFGLYSGLIKDYHNLDNDVELKLVLDLYYQSFRTYRISPQQFFDLYPIRETVTGAWWNGGTFDPDTVFEGKYSYQVTDDRRNANVAGTCPELIKINPEKPYWLKWQAKTLNDKQQYCVTVKSYTTDRIPITWHLQGKIGIGSTHWHKDSLFLDPVNPQLREGLIFSRPLPKEAQFVSIQLYPVVPDKQGEETGTVWFDNLQFIDENSGENLLPHGNFEQDIQDLDVKLDFSEFDVAARKYLDEYGFTGFRVKVSQLRPGPYVGRKTGWYSGFINGTAEYKKLIGLYLKSFQDHLEANGWLGKEYMYWVDEPKHSDYAFVREGMNTIHEAAPKLTRFITENNPGPEIMDVTEIGCPVLTKFNPEKSKEWINRGRKMWSYLMTWPKAPHVNLFIDSDAINLRMWLWISYRYHLSGILVWNSNTWNAEGCAPPGVLQNIWADPMTYMDGHGTPVGAAAEYGNGDGMFFYPPNRDPNNDKTKYLTGPVPSLRLEILREGIDDYDYLVMLENCMKNAKPGQQTLVNKAKQLLNYGDEVFVNNMNYSKDPEILGKYRQQIGELLERFNFK
jgi:hypothetical protein